MKNSQYKNLDIKQLKSILSDLIETKIFQYNRKYVMGINISPEDFKKNTEFSIGICNDHIDVCKKCLVKKISEEENYLTEEELNDKVNEFERITEKGLKEDMKFSTK